MIENGFLSDARDRLRKVSGRTTIGGTMKKVNIHRLREEEGFWSALLILFLVTLTLMGMGASALLRTEGSGAAERIEAMDADYAANGAAYYGIQRLNIGVVDESEVLTIGHSSVTLDSSQIAGSPDVLLIVTASNGGTNRGIEIRFRPGTPLADKAIYTMGHVYNVETKDSTGTEDSDYLVKQAYSVPAINTAALNAMSTAQGHDQSAATFEPADEYPNGSFYRPDGITPNVTHVLNNFKVKGSRDVYGIFVVEGDVTLNGTCRVHGVIYLPNPTSTVITGGGDPDESTITGGIVSHGDISGTGNHISVQHDPLFMDEFCVFQTGPDPEGMVVNWNYF